MSDNDHDRIVRCAIHPAIGIARVGNAAPEDYYLAPEIPGRPGEPGPSGYKTPRGRSGARPPASASTATTPTATW